jgi:hypothetical protein
VAATRIRGPHGHLICEPSGNNPTPAQLQADATALWLFLWNHVSMRDIFRKVVAKYIENFPDWVREDFPEWAREDLADYERHNPNR